ncbi:MAG: von Willebrand factor type A protein [Clostridium butyricum DORA_1]|nr:MAG: von Willebrand factor type A protein [Clostridium butyricum DORA_1]MDU1507574.1 VWA domain-containing protein [Clostridium butyricum]
MKLNKKKRLLSLLFSIVFILCTIGPICVKATGETPPDIKIDYLGTEPSNPVVGQNFKVKYKISPQPFEYEDDVKEKQIILVLDKSGSMKNENKMINLKAAAINFIDSLTATGTDGQIPKIKNLKIGIVSYSDNGEITKELTSVTDVNKVNRTNIMGLESTINSMYADGGTNTGDGLRKAAYLLNNRNADNDNKTIIFMSDGLPTYYSGLYERKWVGNWWPPNYGHYEDVDKGFYTNINEENPSGDYFTKVKGPGNSDDTNSNCLNYAKTIGGIIQTQVGCNIFSIGYGLGNENSDSNKKMKAIHQSMGGKESNFFTSGTGENAINSIFQSIAGKILKTNFDDLKLELDLGENFTVESGLEITDGNNAKTTIKPIVYRKDSENANRYIADEQIVEFTVKTQKDGKLELIKGGKMTYTDIDGNHKEVQLSAKSISIEKTNENVIKILEIEPADCFKLTNSGGISIDPGESYKNQIKIPKEESTLVQVNGITKYISITHLTMAEFISRVDEISGQYDAVVIGRENRMVERKYDGGQHGNFEWIETEYKGTKKYRDYTNPFTDKNNRMNNIFQEFQNDEIEYYAENDITKKRADEIEKMYNNNQLVYMDVNIGINEEYRDSIKYGENSWDLRNDGAIHYPIEETNLYSLYNKLSNCKKFSKNESMTALHPQYAQQINGQVIPSIENDITIEKIVSDYENMNSEYKRPEVYNYERENNNNKLSITVNVNQNDDVRFKLYIDTNGDGIFNEQTENINNIESVCVSSEKGGINQYKIEYSLNKSFWGYLGWKLEVIKNNTNLIKTNIIEFDNIPRKYSEPKRKIEILQLYPSYWYNGDVGNGNVDEDALPKELSENNKFKQLIDELSGDYTITIRRKRINDFNKEVLNGTDKFENYNSVIIGFGKNDTIGSYNDKLDNKVIHMLKDYIISGKSVVFTADTMAQNIDTKYEGTSTLTQAFRDIIGQSRYKDPYNEDELGLDGFKIYHDKLNDFDKYSAGVVADANNGNWTRPTENNGKYYAEIVNKCQNTTYPFNLNDEIEISKYDRAQIYQLNLEDEDVVPIYNIKNNYLNTGDSRNFYHTYSKGNITYCSSLPNFENEVDNKFPVDELKLFLNSIIKSYGNSNSAPVIKSEYLDNKINNNQNIQLDTINTKFIFTTEAYDKDNDNVELQVKLDDEESNFDFTSGLNPKLQVEIPTSKLKEAYERNDKKLRIKVVATDEKGAASEEVYILNLSNILVVHHGMYKGISNGEVEIDESNNRTFNIARGAKVYLTASVNGNIVTNQFSIKSDLELNTPINIYNDNNLNNLIGTLSTSNEVDGDGKYLYKYSGEPINSDYIIILYSVNIPNRVDLSNEYSSMLNVENNNLEVKIKAGDLPDLF